MVLFFCSLVFYLLPCGNIEHLVTKAVPVFIGMLVVFFRLPLEKKGRQDNCLARKWARWPPAEVKPFGSG